MRRHAAICSWWLSVIAGLVAAGFWAWSALLSLPTPVSYWGNAPLTDPFVVALSFSARLNAWAAGMTAASITFQAFERLFRGGAGG